MPMFNFSKGNNSDSVLVKMSADIRKRFENFTNYIDSKEHTPLNKPMYDSNEITFGFSTAPFIIGGFVGSKSQMNKENSTLLYSLSTLFKNLHDYDKLREKKFKSSTKNNDIGGYYNTTTTSATTTTNEDTTTCDFVIEKTKPTLTINEVHEKIDENRLETVIKEIACDATENIHDEKINEGNDENIKCLKTFIIEAADRTEEEISGCLNNEEEKANEDKDAEVQNSNSGVLENGEESDANVFSSLSPGIWRTIGLRTRQHSECSVESADSDSFIAFEENCCVGPFLTVVQDTDSDVSDSDCSFYDGDSDEIPDEDPEDYYESETDDDDNDDWGPDLELVYKEIAEANERWSESYKDVTEDDGECNRKVTFKDKVTVHRMVAWDYAYRAARPGPWERFAHDRLRFKQRIIRLGYVISPVLREDHRKSVYNKLHA